MSDVIVDVTTTPISILPPVATTVLIEITAPGGFNGGMGIEAFPFSRSTLFVSTGGIPLPLDGSYTLESYTLACGTAPTGAAIILDVNKNGVSLFTTQANRPTIPAGSLNGTVTMPNITTFVAGDKITVDIDQVGSSVAGANLDLVLRLRRTS
jgi:hypothetical protein